MWPSHTEHLRHPLQMRPSWVNERRNCWIGCINLFPNVGTVSIQLCCLAIFTLWRISIYLLLLFYPSVVSLRFGLHDSTVDFSFSHWGSSRKTDHFSSWTSAILLNSFYCQKSELLLKIFSLYWRQTLFIPALSRLVTNCASLFRLAADMQSLISPVTKAILVALFIFAILLILYVILWYICRDVDCDHGIWCWTFIEHHWNGIE